MISLPHLKKLSFYSALLSTICCGGGGGSGENFDLPTKEVPIKVEKVLSNVNFPVGLTFIPDGTLFFSELKSGLVKTLTPSNSKAKSYAKLEVSKVGAEGLLGIIADPDYTTNGYVYVYQALDNPFRNRVLRLHRNDDGVTTETVILDNLPISGHNGGKFVFGNDNKLFITTGDTGNPALSQDLNSLAGKVLRINKDGSIPIDNPIPDSPIFALGIRNAFGITKYPQSGTIYISENGPDCNDEINRVTALDNFGWRPEQSCDDKDKSYKQPIININPVLGVTALIFYAGAEFPELQNRLLLSDVNTGSIRRYVIDDNNNGQVLEEGFLYQGGSGGIIDMTTSPDGKIYFTTQDGIYKITRD